LTAFWSKHFMYLHDSINQLSAHVITRRFRVQNIHLIIINVYSSYSIIKSSF